MKGKRKKFIISLVIWLVAALIILLVGGYIAGWDILGFFSSNLAIWLYVLTGVYFGVIIAFILWDRIKNQ